jgi:hypothetical protein
MYPPPLVLVAPASVYCGIAEPKLLMRPICCVRAHAAPRLLTLVDLRPSTVIDGVVIIVIVVIHPPCAASAAADAIVDVDPA